MAVSSICVPASDCDSVRKAAIPWKDDHGNLTCRDCDVAGCVECADDTNCLECETDFELLTVAGTAICTWRFLRLFIGVLIVLSVVVVWLGYDVITACRLPVLNPHVDFGLEKRTEQKLRDMRKPGFPQYSMTESMHFGAPPILGVGITLFFNWMLFVIVVCATAAAIAFFMTPSDLQIKASMPDSCDSFTPLHASKIGSVYSEPVRKWNFEVEESSKDQVLARDWTLLVVINSMTWAFLGYQRYVWFSKRQSKGTVGRYAVELLDLPLEYTKSPDVVAELNRVLRDELGSKGGVDMVSIGFVFHEHADEIARLVD